MKARAESAEQTRTRIMEAAIELADEKPLLALALPEIAERAGVAVQTLLRQFGSRDGLLDATMHYARDQVLDERRITPGDIDSGIHTLVDHYEHRGDGVLLLLGQEAWEPRAAEVTATGKRLHAEWVAELFEPRLAATSTADRAAILDLLVVATDVYTWKILRRDRRLSRSETEKRMLRLVGAILEGI